MFDSLCRRFLEPYGCQTVHTPNFSRLARHSVTFDNSFVGSMPCMPARRELHTGRYNFLHRCWGPLEPFDNSAIAIMRDNGVYTHLISDHMHYWEDGGTNYHTKYNSWECVRGQEGDFWKAQVENRPTVEDLPGRADIYRQQEIINREYIQKPEEFPLAKTFAGGMEFLEKNHQADRWFLQIECFDPHEPFYSHQKYHEKYFDDYCGATFDWPAYAKVSETQEQIEHVRNQYFSLLSACDDHLGMLLDFMDEQHMWDDTMLIVCTDHGYLLGEHGWWAKNAQPMYNEVAHTPLFIWDPVSSKQNSRCDRLVQLIDIPVTLLDFFDQQTPDEMLGISLLPVIAHGAPTREAVLFGTHGQHMNITDGRYVYMRAPVKGNIPLYNYTLMPVDIRYPFADEELRKAQLSGPFAFTKGMPVLKTPAKEWFRIDFEEFPSVLYDLQVDSKECHPISDTETQARLIGEMVRIMKENDCPAEQFERLALEAYCSIPLSP